MTELLEPPQILAIGPDRARITPQDVVVEARRSLPDWEVREINHVPIYVEDKKYYLVEKRKGEAPFGVRYLLKPWPADQVTNAVGFLTFDLDAVNARDAAARESQVQDIGRAFLMPFYPIFGFLWSGLQTRLARFGFLPHAMTGFSIFTSFSLLFGEGVFAVILLNSSLRTGKVLVGGFLRAVAAGDTIDLGLISVPVMLLDIGVALALVVDLIARYSNYLRDDQWAGGFFEWLLARKKTTKREKAALPSVSVPEPVIVESRTTATTPVVVPQQVQVFASSRQR